MAEPWMSLEEGPNPMMSHELSHQDADEVLAKDLAEQMRQAWYGIGTLPIPRDATAGILTEAVSLYYDMIRESQVWSGETVRFIPTSERTLLAVLRK